MINLKNKTLPCSLDVQNVINPIGIELLFCTNRINFKRNEGHQDKTLRNGNVGFLQQLGHISYILSFSEETRTDFILHITELSQKFEFFH